MEKDYSILLNEVKEKVEKRITEIHKDEDLKVTGTAFEDIVLDELVEAGIKKEEISHSARKFPDFVIEDKEKGIRIGLEVKKTDEDKWEVPGGSIFESLRNHIETVDEEAMRERLMSWADAVSKESTMDYELSMDALKTFFDEIC